ncbi:MAG: glycosyltransferase family 4 protein [Patescibacteria group bacterium]|jgi:glycosyltransferase involved in cell wall biosynthesis
MRILVLNYEYPPLGGGGSYVSHEIAKGYVRQGHAVDVVTMGLKGLPSYENIDGVSVYRVPSGRKKYEISHLREQLYYLWSAYFKIKSLRHQRQWDVCHCHFLVPTGILAVIIKKLFHIPYIITAHGSDVPGHNTERFTLLHKLTPRLIKGILRNALHVTVPSSYLKKLIQKNISGTREIPIMVIPNGSSSLHDTSIQKERIILSVGRMLPFKGFQYIIEAFQNLHASDWRLVLVGDGPYKKELEAQSAGNTNIQFTGWINKNDPQFARLYNAASIFMLLSRQESQGIVLVEAMSTGCAIIASDAPAIRETLGQNNSLIISPDVAATTKALRLLIENQSQREFFSSQSQKRFKDFTWDAILSKYMHLITSAHE